MEAFESRATKGGYTVSQDAFDQCFLCFCHIASHKLSLFGNLLYNNHVNVYESGYSRSVHRFPVCLATPCFSIECGFVPESLLKLVFCMLLQSFSNQYMGGC